MDCVACGSNRTNVSPGSLAPFIVLRTGLPSDAASTIDCLDCACHFSSHRFSDDEAQAVYAGYRGEEYNRERDSCEPGYTVNYASFVVPEDHKVSAAAYVRGFLSDRDVVSCLDFGGHDGSNCAFSADVFEIGDAWPVRKYDVVYMAHVLEHVSFPRETVTRVRGLLKPGGVMFAEVPVESLVRVWHEHITQYSQESLIRVFGDGVLGCRFVSTSFGPVLQAVSR